MSNAVGVSVKRGASWLLETFWRFPMRVLARPFKSFDALKFEKKGSYVFAFFVLILECLISIMNFVYKGFLINYSDIYHINSLYLALTVLFPVGLFVVGNWCVTTLMNGKGKLGEIFQVTMYAMFPMCILQLIALFLSNVLILDEMTFVYALQTIGAVLLAGYGFIGVTVIHEYGFGQSLGALILTVVAMMILIFILMLVFALVADVWDFFTVVSKELMLKYF